MWKDIRVNYRRKRSFTQDLQGPYYFLTSSMVVFSSFETGIKELSPSLPKSHQFPALILPPIGMRPGQGPLNRDQLGRPPV